MSSYVEFFIKAGDFYAPIYSESRSGAIYQAFQYQVPYEQSRALTQKDLNEVCNEQRSEKADLERRISAAQEKIEWLRTSTLSAEERMEEYNGEREMVEYYKEEIAHADYVMNFCSWLGEMLEEIRYRSDTCKRLAVDPDHYVFVGIDCGNPGFKDLDD